MGLLGPSWFAGDEDAAPGSVYHYTNVRALRQIVRSGVLLPHKTLPGDRLPLLWFSDNAIWEAAAGRPTAWNRFQPVSFDVLSQQRGGLGRILVEATVAPLAWTQLRRLVDPRWVAMAEQQQNTWFAAN